MMCAHYPSSTNPVLTSRRHLLLDSGDFYTIKQFRWILHTNFHLPERRPWFVDEERLENLAVLDA